MRHSLLNKVVVSFVFVIANYSFAMPESFYELLAKDGIWLGTAQYFRAGETSSFPYATQIVDDGKSLKTIKRSQNDPYQNYELSAEGLKFDLNFDVNNKPAVTGVLDQFEEIENGWKFTTAYRGMTVDFMIVKQGDDALQIKTLWNGKLHALVDLTRHNIKF